MRSQGKLTSAKRNLDHDDVHCNKQIKENKLLAPCHNLSALRSLPVKRPLLILFDLTSSVLLCLDLLSSTVPSVLLFSHDFLSAFILSFDPVLPPLFIFLSFYISPSILLFLSPSPHASFSSSFSLSSLVSFPFFFYFFTLARPLSTLSTNIILNEGTKKCLKR